MKKASVAIGALTVALVASNALWAFNTLDAGIARTYARASFESTSELLAQTIAVLPVVAKEGASQTEVVAAAQVPNDSTAPYEKEGYVWVGQLGLKFNQHGRLVRAVAGPEALEQ